MSIDILKTTDSTKYLGKKLTFADPHQAEIKNRIAAGWRKFFTLKQELTSSCYSLNDRLRLFQGTITPTVLYGSASWTMTTELENQLRKSHRQMLRMILSSPRRILHDISGDDDSGDDGNEVEETLEPWVEWIQRCTHTVEAKLAALNLEQWVVIQRKRQWRWAYKIANDATRWSHSVINWDPSIDMSFNTRRRPGRQKKRWSDNIVEYIKKVNNAIDTNAQNVPQWQDFAKDQVAWQSMESAFASNP